MTPDGPETLSEVLRAAEARPDAEAVVCGDRRHSHAELAGRAARLASRLAGAGVRPGDHVAIRLPRSDAYVLSYFAAAAAGAVIVPVSHRWTPTESRATLGYCDVTTLITDPPGAGELMAGEAGGTADAGLPADLRRVVVLGTGREGSPLPRRDASTGPEVIRLDHPGRADPADDPFPAPAGGGRPDPDETALLLHTSGTTSAPRRVMLSHRNVLSSARAHARSVGARSTDRALVALPMHFGYCNTAQMLTHLLLKGTLVLMPGPFTPARFGALVERERATSFTAVPTMLTHLARSDRTTEHDLTSLRRIVFGGSGIPERTLAVLARKLPGVDLVQTYGLTEAGPRVTTLPPEEIRRRPDSVGKPIPGVTVRVVGQGGRELEPYEVGEVTVRGPGVTSGYYRRPEATREALRDGALHTGDLGYVDDQGFLYLVGRSKNVIIRGGMNIYPEEVEERLNSHPGISEAAVVGRDHPVQGEVPVAHVVRRDGADCSAEELLEHCRAALTPQKLPTTICFVAELPKTYNQKIQRWRLE